jgi:hypothetical protein
MTPSNASGSDTASGDRVPDDHRTVHDDEHDDDRRDQHDDESERSPNFLIRRAIVIGGVVAAIVGGGLVVNALIRNDGDDDVIAGSVEWNSIALVDQRSGDVITTDTAGVEQARFPSGIRSTIDATAIGSTLMVTSADAVAVVDLASETSQTFDVAGSDPGVVTPSGSTDVMLAADAGGDRIVFAHGPTGDVFDTATFPPIAGAQFDTESPIATPDGRSVLVTDTGNFQSVLLSFDSDEPTFFTGRSLALDDDVVVTTQNVGNEASINVFSHDGATVTTTRAPSVRAGMVSGDKVLLVTVDGEIIELATSSGTTSSLGTTEIGPIRSGYVTPIGDRLVVVGDDGTAIVDADGAVVADFDAAAPVTGRPGEAAPRTSTCLALERAADGTVLVANLNDGAIVEEAEVRGSLEFSSDGCAVVAVVPTAITIVSATGVERVLVDGAFVAIAPDAGSVIVESQSRLVLIGVADALAESGSAEPSSVTAAPASSAPDDSVPGGAGPGIDIGPSTRIVGFTDL